eukprot:m.347449 g.347449  ORF g.347449 m.347449 type:complete len:90 (-) comp32741_c0_seq1:90-359(-)
MYHGLSPPGNLGPPKTVCNTRRDANPVIASPSTAAPPALCVVILLKSSSTSILGRLSCAESILLWNGEIATTFYPSYPSLFHISVTNSL